MRNVWFANALVGLLNVYEVNVGNNKKFYMVCYEAKDKQIID